MEQNHLVDLWKSLSLSGPWILHLSVSSGGGGGERMKWSLLKVILSVSSCALLASEQGGVNRAGLSTCLFFFFHCIVAGVD